MYFLVLFSNQLSEEERAGCFTVVLLLLSSVFCVSFFMVLRVGQRSVIVAYLGHTHLL